MAILTISRQYGSGATEIGRGVAEALSYDYVDKERILTDIRQLGHNWEKWANELDEHYPSMWEKYDWSFRGFGALIQSMILNYAVRDNVVIMGRGGNFALMDVPHALGIRVVAPIEARIERITKRESVDGKTARWLLKKMDHEMAGFIFSIYGKHSDDSQEYELIFDSGFKPLDEIIAKIVVLLQKRDALKTNIARANLQMRAAAARIKASLATDPSLFVPILDVTCDGEQLVLQGIVHNPRERKKVEEVAKRLAGSRPLRCELHYRG